MYWILHWDTEVLTFVFICWFCTGIQKSKQWQVGSISDIHGGLCLDEGNISKNVKLKLCWQRVFETQEVFHEMATKIHEHFTKSCWEQQALHYKYNWFSSRVFVLDLEHPVWVAAWIQFSGYENDADIWAFESICWIAMWWGSGNKECFF